MVVEDSQAEYRRALGGEGQCRDRPPRRLQSVPKSTVAARRGEFDTARLSVRDDRGQTCRRERR